MEGNACEDNACEGSGPSPLCVCVVGGGYGKDRADVILHSDSALSV